MTSLRIAWFSELAAPGAASVSAYCSRMLLPKLAQQHSIEVFSESADGRGVDGIPQYHYLNAYRRHRENPFDIFFYQLEDSKSSRFIRAHIGLMPGVTWFHDFFFHDLGPEACHTSPWETTIRQFHDPSIPFADRSVAPHQLWPRGYREASLSPVTLFSSAWARNEFSTMVSNRIESFDGGHLAEVLSIPVEEFRKPKRGASGLWRIASASLAGIEGRSHKLLPALKQLKVPWQLTWMVNESERGTALDVAREFGLEDRIELISPRTCESWERIVQASDLALHLHTSPFGHLTPYVQISLATGTPTAVSYAAQGEDFPADVVFHVEPGLHESTQLRAICEGVIEGHSHHRYGQRGRDHIRTSANVDTVAARLSEILVEAAPRVREVMKRWAIVQRHAEVELLREVRALVDLDTIPGISPYEHTIANALSELAGALFLPPS